jgi:excisionase family DNA binding protein
MQVDDKTVIPRICESSASFSFGALEATVGIRQYEGISVCDASPDVTSPTEQNAEPLRSAKISDADREHKALGITRQSAPTFVSVADKLCAPEKFRLLTVAEAAEAFGVSKATIYRWQDEGKLKRSSIPGRIHTKSVLNLLDNDPDENI